MSADAKTEPVVGYLLHRFPGRTDTFIKRELQWLIGSGLRAGVISVWKPSANETTPDIMAQWSSRTDFLLAASRVKMAGSILKEFHKAPTAFLRSALLAFKTSRPGVKGLAMQAAYFIEAVLAQEPIRRNRYTHLHNHIGDQSATVAMLAAKIAGIGYSMTIHGWPVFFDVEKHRLSEKIKSAGFTRSIGYFCRSQLMMIAGSTDPERFKIVRCGLFLEEFPFVPKRTGVSRLLCVARMSPEKGLTFLLEAVKLLADQRVDCQLRLAGDGPIRQQLEKCAVDLGIHSRVTFLGFLDEKNIRAELALADAFLLTSYVEGIPVSAMEAMACGVPVIATNVGGTGELVFNGKTGLLIPPSNPHAVADAIIQLQDNPAQRYAMVKAARQLVGSDYDGQKEFPKLLAHFKEYGLRRYAE
jgi:colanic acid/amylovoran biosynthesis glycosyltransferase